MSEDTAAVEEAPEATDDTATADTQPAEPTASLEDVERRHKEETSKRNKENASLRARLRELEPLAQAAKAAEDAQKSEAQKLAERLASTEKELSESRSTTTRLFAAATHNIPADLIDLLGNGTDEEIDARAKLLAAKLAPAPTEEQAPVASGSQRPVESLRPGASPQTGADPNDPNAWIREYVNRGR